MVAVGSCLHASVVGALVGHALYVGTDAAPTPARASIPLITGVLPTKFDAVLVQLEAEPAGVGLAPGAVYASPEAFVAAVDEAIGRLNLVGLHAAYQLQLVDVYPLDPMAPGAPAGFVSLAAGATAITMGSFADSRGFTVHYSFFSFICFGLHLSASRDGPGQPTRMAFQALGAFCGTVGFQRAGPAGTMATASAFTQWLEATRPSVKVPFMYEAGLAIDRREQCVRDRHNLVFGTREQKELVIGRLALTAPISARAPQLHAILGGSPTISEVVDVLRQLSRSFSRSESSVTSFGQLLTLERAYELAAQAALAAPGLTTISARLDAVVKSASGFAPSSSSGTAGATPGSSQSTSGLYDRDLAAALGLATWRTYEAQLAALCVPAAAGGAVNQVHVYQKLMASPILGVRQLTLDKSSEYLNKLKQLSSVVVRAIDALEDFHFIAARCLGRAPYSPHERDRE